MFLGAQASSRFIALAVTVLATRALAQSHTALALAMAVRGALPVPMAVMALMRPTGAL